MNSSGYVLYKVNNAYYMLFVFVAEENRCEPTDKYFEEVDLRIFLHNSFLLKEDIVSNLGVEGLADSNRYYVWRDKDMIVFFGVKESVSLSWLLTNRKPINYEMGFVWVKSKLLEYDIGRKYMLLDGMVCSKKSLKENVEYIVKYVLYNHYSLWVYNKYSDFFSLSVSSFEPEKKYISRDDNTLFYNFLEGDKDFESRDMHSGVFHADRLSEAKSLSRIKLEIGDEKTSAILSFYSIHKNYSMSENAAYRIKRLLEVKYYEEYRDRRCTIGQMEDYISYNYKPGALKEFMRSLVKKICKTLMFESCSVLLKDDDVDVLKLYATYGINGNDLPDVQVVYALGEVTLTTIAYEKGEYYSYDLKHDPYNSHKFDEDTLMLGSSNWIGICISGNDLKKGVIRVKNKYYEDCKGVRYLGDIDPFDISVLKDISKRISYMLNVEQMTDRSLMAKEVAQKNLESANDFNKVFLHEIRTPISKFNTGPERIKIELNNLPVMVGGESRLKSIYEKLGDIQMMGARLGFISKVYYFNDLVSPGIIKRLSVMHDVIFPVLNISRDYIKKQYNIFIDLIAVKMSGVSVYGDMIKLQIVFHSMIDNASKYNKGESPITIDGNYDKGRGYYNIIVYNYGIEILAEEVERIFEKGERGVNAEKEKIGGTGIGLYLSKMIMKNQGGDLILLSRSNPVSFCIKILTKKKQNNENGFIG